MCWKTWNHFFKFAIHFVCKKFPGNITNKYMENLKQASQEI